MLIVRLLGGLCNQMYGYMAGYALAKELKQELVLDIEECVHSAFGYSLDYFNIPSSRKIVYFWDVLLPDEQGFYDRILETYKDAVVLVQSYEQKKEYLDNDRVIAYSGLDMADELKGYENLYMPGYFFERERYYQKYWNELRTLFVLKEENEDIKNFREMIYGKNSVGVHIRRRDMLSVDWSYKVEDDFYRAAIECCRELYDNCTFYVFSDDIEYARKMLGADSSVHYIHFYGYDNASVSEFCCLSLCKHRILTIDSTFGQLADDLSQEKEGHVLIRDRIEGNRGGIVERSKKRWIYLNKDDIQMYSSKYRLIENKRLTADGLSQYKKFLEQVKENRIHEALQLAFCIYHEKKGDMEFRLRLAEVLIKIGVDEESVIELAQMPADIVDNWFRNHVLEEKRKKQLIHLYNKMCTVNKKHFIIVLREKILTDAGYDNTYGLIDLAIILSHLGHMATVISEEAKSSEESCLKTDNYLYNVRGINMECFHIGKESVLAFGITDFYNNFAEDELIIISRDERFFVRDNCVKKLCFITTDGTDLNDREIFAMPSNNDRLAISGNKADFILTQDNGLAATDERYIYWEDRGFKEKFIFIEFPWEYGYGRRLNQRMLGMAEALVCACCKEK